MKYMYVSIQVGGNAGRNTNTPLPWVGKFYCQSKSPPHMNTHMLTHALRLASPFALKGYTIKFVSLGSASEEISIRGKRADAQTGTVDTAVSLNGTCGGSADCGKGFSLWISLLE